MRKPADLRWKMKILLAGALLLLLWMTLKLPCVPRTITGVICPGCGMSRAWLAALALDFPAAFAYHPMFWSVPVFFLFWLYDCRLLKNRTLNNWILGGLTVAFVGCYLIRLIVFSGGGLAI